MEKAETVLRVERGRAGEEDLAAIAVVLLALRARGTQEPAQPASPGWSWWERPNGYAPPASWRCPDRRPRRWPAQGDLTA